MPRNANLIANVAGSEDEIKIVSRIDGAAVFLDAAIDKNV